MPPDPTPHIPHDGGDRPPVAVPPGAAMLTPSTLDPETVCRGFARGFEELIEERCADKRFLIDVGACAGGAAGSAVTDLVVLIDTSGSMADEAADLSAAADAAIAAAAAGCPSDLRVDWFGIEGTWPATNFTQSYRDALGVPDAQLIGQPGQDEDGAAAIVDLARHYGWRSGAARAIFYLGDEALRGGDPHNVEDVTAADMAIDEAVAHGVTVFTYFGTSASGDAGAVANEYARVAQQTGGQAFTAPVASVGGFQAVLESVICSAGTEACTEAKLPTIAPCIRLHWGDGERDRLETDDVEVMCITVTNPHSNLTLRNFTLHLSLTTENGDPAPLLPDGSPSVMVRPESQICFGDIGPCDPTSSSAPSGVSREVVLIARGAEEAAYLLHYVYCFDVAYTQTEFRQHVRLPLVAS